MPVSEISSPSIIRNKKKLFPDLVYVVTFNAAIGGFLFGYNTAITNGALLQLENDYDLTSWNISLASLTVIGAAGFSIPAGILSDIIGRKKGIMLSSLVFIVGSMVITMSFNIFMVILGLFINGVGIGFASVIVPVYIAECSPKEIRGRLVTSFQLMITAGILFQAILAAITHFVYNGWRLVFAVVAIPSILQLINFQKLPESPRYLVMKENIDDARNVLESIRDSENQNTAEIRDIQSSVETNSEKTGFQAWKSLLKTCQVRNALKLGCMLQPLQQLTGINIVFFFSISIVKNMGVPLKDALWISVMPCTVNFLATFIGMNVIDTLGRRKLITYSFFACALSCLLLMGGFLMNSRSSPSVSTVFDLGSTGHCSKQRNCLKCIQDSTCIYCAPSEDNYQKGSCVDSYKDELGQLFAKDGRCSKNSTVFDSMDLLKDDCPQSLNILSSIGFLAFVISFAAGVGPVPWVINAENLPLWARSIGFSITVMCNWLSNIVISKTFAAYGSASNAYAWFFCFAVTSALAGLYSMKYVKEPAFRPLEFVESLFMTKVNKKLFQDFMIQNRVTAFSEKPAEEPEVMIIDESKLQDQQSEKAGSSADPDQDQSSQKNLQDDNKSVKSKASEKSGNSRDTNR